MKFTIRDFIGLLFIAVFAVAMFRFEGIQKKRYEEITKEIKDSRYDIRLDSLLHEYNKIVLDSVNRDLRQINNQIRANKDEILINRKQYEKADSIYRSIVVDMPEY